MISRRKNKQLKNLSKILSFDVGNGIVQWTRVLGQNQRTPNLEYISLVHSIPLELPRHQIRPAETVGHRTSPGNTDVVRMGQKITQKCICGASSSWAVVVGSWQGVVIVDYFPEQAKSRYTRYFPTANTIHASPACPASWSLAFSAIRLNSVTNVLPKVSAVLGVLGQVGVRGARGMLPQY